MIEVLPEMTSDILFSFCFFFSIHPFILKVPKEYNSPECNASIESLDIEFRGVDG